MQTLFLRSGNLQSKTALELSCVREVLGAETVPHVQESHCMAGADNNDW